jgi:hypothetical protein
MRAEKQGSVNEDALKWRETKRKSDKSELILIVQGEKEKVKKQKNKHVGKRKDKEHIIEKTEIRK